MCGHPHDRPDQAKLFSNLCEMRQQGCENSTIYVATHAPGACSKVEKTGKIIQICPEFVEQLPKSVPRVTVMPNSSPDDIFFNPFLKLIIDSFSCLILCAGA